MFDRFEIPTPFQVGAVNCYLSERTLVDPGPDSEDAWGMLQETLAGHGLAVDDIEQVLITHPHPDHFGLAGRLRDVGARIIASPEAAEIIEGFADRLAFEQSFFVPFFSRHGLQEDVARPLVELPEAYLEFAPDVTVDRRLDDGEAIRIGGTVVTAEAVRGHALGELIFTYHGGDGHHAIVGDHVLDPITPNPFLQAPFDSSGDRPRMLPAYNRSLDRLAETGYTSLLPGHRELIERPTHRIEQLRRFHEHRTDQTEAAIVEPMTAAVVMRELFGDLPVTEMFAGMSEAIGHLDVLEERGRIERRADGEAIHFAPVGSDQ